MKEIGGLRMTDVNLTDNRNFILNILEFNLYQAKSALVSDSVSRNGSEYNTLTSVQHLLDNVSSHLSVSLNHNELRELARCCFRFSDYFNRSSHSKTSKLSIKVLESFIRTCSRDAINKITKIIFGHRPNEEDIETILAL